VLNLAYYQHQDLYQPDNGRAVRQEVEKVANQGMGRVVWEAQKGILKYPPHYPRTCEQDHISFVELSSDIYPKKNSLDQIIQLERKTYKFSILYHFYNWVNTNLRATFIHYYSGKIKLQIVQFALLDES
jgi:hypothetical protein